MDQILMFFQIALWSSPVRRHYIALVLNELKMAVVGGDTLHQVVCSRILLVSLKVYTSWFYLVTIILTYFVCFSGGCMFSVNFRWLYISGGFVSCVFHVIFVNVYFSLLYISHIFQAVVCCEYFSLLYIWHIFQATICYEDFSFLYISHIFPAAVYVVNISGGWRWLTVLQAVLDVSACSAGWRAKPSLPKTETYIFMLMRKIL